MVPMVLRLKSREAIARMRGKCRERDLELVTTPFGIAPNNQICRESEYQLGAVSDSRQTFVAYNRSTQHGMHTFPEHDFSPLHKSELRHQRATIASRQMQGEMEVCRKRTGLASQHL